MPVEPRGLQASRMFRDTFAIFNGGISRVNKTDTLTVKWGDLLEEPYEGNLQVRFCEGTGSVIIVDVVASPTQPPAEPSQFRSDIFK